MIATTKSFGVFTHDPAKVAIGTIYSFPKAGDELPLHVHADHGHCSIVTAGSFELFDDQGATRILKRHDVIPQFTPGRQHGFRALEDNSELINIGIPGTGV